MIPRSFQVELPDWLAAHIDRITAGDPLRRVDYRQGARIALGYLTDDELKRYAEDKKPNE